MVEQPQLLFEQECAVEPLVGGHDFGEAAELLGALALGGFEQRRADVLDPPPALGFALAVLVPVGAPDVVDGAAGELAHVEGVEHNLGSEPLVALGDGVDRVLLAGDHVDRDPLDGVPPLAQQLEERLQRRGVAAGRVVGEHDIRR